MNESERKQVRDIVRNMSDEVEALSDPRNKDDRLAAIHALKDALDELLLVVRMSEVEEDRRKERDLERVA